MSDDYDNFFNASSIFPYTPNIKEKIVGNGVPNLTDDLDIYNIEYLGLKDEKEKSEMKKEKISLIGAIVLKNLYSQEKISGKYRLFVATLVNQLNWVVEKEQLVKENTLFKKTIEKLETEATETQKKILQEKETELETQKQEREKKEEEKKLKEQEEEKETQERLERERLEREKKFKEQQQQEEQEKQKKLTEQQQQEQERQKKLKEQQEQLKKKPTIPIFKNATEIQKKLAEISSTNPLTEELKIGIQNFISKNIIPEITRKPLRALMTHMSENISVYVNTPEKRTQIAQLLVNLETEKPIRNILLELAKVFPEGVEKTMIKVATPPSKQTK